MYTPEQYARAKALLNDPGTEAKYGPDGMGKLHQKLAEYEAAQQGTSLPPADVARLQTPLAIGGALPNENIAPDYQYHPPDDFDENLPNATKRKKYQAPPEYVTKQPGKALATLAANRFKDPLNGSNGAMYFEPSEKQFSTDMGEYLKAKGVKPGSEEYNLAFADYKDRKWEQAYQQAAATDEPLLRVAYVPEDANGWSKLQAHLAEATDTAAAFAHGFASGGTLGLTRAIQSDADREQLARHPVAETIGELGGAVSPGSLIGKLTGGIGRAAKAAGVGKYGASAIAGGLGSAADVAGHAGADEVSNRLNGRPVDEDAKSRFGLRLLGGTLLGAGAGVAGEGLSSLAQSYRTSLRNPTSPLGTELTNAESTGTATDALSGLKPSSDVARYLEKARGPVPGEDKALPTGSAVEYAASDVREPIVARQELEQSSGIQRMGAEKQSMFSSVPELKKPKPVKAIGDELLRTILERSKPMPDGSVLPSEGEALGLENNRTLIGFLRDVRKPRLVLAVDAAKEAARTGGAVVSLEDAGRAGFKVKGLENEVNPETGLPHNAPPLSGNGSSSMPESALPPDGSMPWFPQANPVEVLPKYGKDQLATHAADVAAMPPATPEQADALNKWSFGHDEAIRGVQRGDPDAAIIQKRLEAYGGPVDKLGAPHEQHLAEAKEAARHIAEYLSTTPPSSKLPFVYRGLVLSREEAKKFLQQSEFDLGAAASSVSADPAVARSFVARNAKPGDVGITLKLEHNAARDISPYAADRVKVERELLMPGGSKFSAVNRFEDASNPGHYIVVGKQAPSKADAFRTALDIDPATNAPLPRDASGIDIGAGSSPELQVTNNAGHDVEIPKNYPPKVFKIILDPVQFDAMKLENQIQAIDRAGKAGSARATPDPVYEKLMAAGREDRAQFPDAWVGMINRHGKELTALEQRAAHAGITERKLYPDMSGNAQKTANAAITNYGVAPKATNEALADLAKGAGKSQEIETLRGTRAYSALKEKALPSVHESIGQGGGFARLGGLIPGMKLRGDALARSFTRGPEGEALYAQAFNPKLVNEPLGREIRPSGPFANILSMGRGALGLKTGSVYDSSTGRAGPGSTLSPEEKATLQRMLEQP